MAYTTVNKPTDHFNTKLYTGNGSSGHAITGVGFQPDWIWWKHRGSATYWHNLMDSVRGASKQLYSNANNSEGTNTNGLESFDSDGFTVGSDNGANESGQNFVSWNWLASNTTASNTDGSITSTVSANTTAGFSIVSWTGNGTSGATVGHGISTPDVIIAKSRSGAHNWYVYHKSNGVGYGKLNLTDAFNSATDVFTVAPTSSVFTISADTSINNSGDNFIAYCFAEKKGYSSFGTYQGNGSSSGSYIYLGFKPSFVMLKRTDTTQDWYMFDNKRDTINPMDIYLRANENGAEPSAFTFFDFLSNGFKCRNSASAVNASGGTYIYMAFAESPFVNSNGVPNNAR